MRTGIYIGRARSASAISARVDDPFCIAASAFGFKMRLIMDRVIYPRSPREMACGWVYLPRFVDADEKRI